MLSCSDPGKGTWIILDLAPTFLHMRFNPVGPTAMRIARAFPILRFHLVENQTERIGTAGSTPTASGLTCSGKRHVQATGLRSAPNCRLAVTAPTMSVTSELGTDNTLATQATGGQ